MIIYKVCKEMEANYENLLLHTKVRWHSHEKPLRRVYELEEEMLAFLAIKDKENFVICFAMTAGSAN